MTISDICKKYGISDSYLNSKDDAHSVAAASLLDLKEIVLNGAQSEDIATKLQFLADFMLDCKNSNH